MTPINDAGSFLLSTLVGLYVFCLLLRFWLHWNNGDLRNPIGQFLLTITNPVILPFGKLITNRRGFAVVSLVAALLITMIKVYLLLRISGISPRLGGVGLYAIGELMQTSIYIFFFAIIIRAIASWLGPQIQYNPVMGIIYSLTEPLLAPARRFIPLVGGLDLSPIAVLIFLELTRIVVVLPILKSAVLY